MRFRSLTLKLMYALAVAAVIPAASHAQEPYAWRDTLVFHTFSIAAVDQATAARQLLLDVTAVRR